MSRVPIWLLHRPIAHRGLHDASHGVVENSLPAFWAAARAGYPVELDARLLADGEVVVMHDADMGRTTNARGPVAHCVSSELEHASLIGAEGDDARVPLLRDVLNLIAGSTPLLIEIKNEGDVGHIEPAVAAALLGYRGAYAVQSFHPGTVRWWREHVPDVVRGLLSGDFRDERLDDAMRQRLRNLDFVSDCEPDFIGYDVRLLPFEPVARERAAGRAVIGWTVRSVEEASRALGHCDNFIFEGFDAASMQRPN
jgi:glycerophosphoryl diester phosphodiesterase